MITESDRCELLRIARDALTAHLTDVRPVFVVLQGAAARQAGAFVTVTVNGELRGCIGQMNGNEPVGDVVRRCAVSAAASDPRFAPVRVDELRDTVLEISVLGPLEKIDDPLRIEIGRHGLVVEDDRHRGLLLPQVATEWGWGPEEFLEQACRKAGLANDAWKQAATVWVFEAEVFSEGR